MIYVASVSVFIISERIAKAYTSKEIEQVGKIKFLNYINVYYFPQANETT